MTRDDLTALAERVEKPAGPDRELDALVALAFGWRNPSPQFGIPENERKGIWIAPGEHPEAPWHSGPPFYTASLDAAMAEALRYGFVNVGSIAADGMPGCCIVTCTDPVTVVTGLSAGGTDDLGRLARATIAAALRAMLASMGDAP